MSIPNARHLAITNGTAGLRRTAVLQLRTAVEIHKASTKLYLDTDWLMLASVNRYAA